ncbi:TadE/TadG family type IV pilus assembly protein [Pseudokineococcus sp. 1T1Z-3]|uniref:TadE/TadG family type IV pilus assembly protein n=1 Tax=Pseudokineococcus sp. 1T1Z-3 TaxID=3132745 RepID=UPI00309D0C14
MTPVVLAGCPAAATSPWTRRPRRRTAAPRRGGDRGATSVELVVLVPLLLALLFAGVQVGQVMLGNQAALAAAREAARVARTGGGDPAALGAAAARGQAYAETVGAGVLRSADVQVVAGDGGLTVRATVTAEANALVPALGGRITQVAEGPVEVFRGDT